MASSFPHVCTDIYINYLLGIIYLLIGPNSYMKRYLLNDHLTGEFLV